ncbi:MAG TPA: response regulator [Bryobacteraceae bacterium]|nr:response regulator [Bryobacteraceae bacterium]
MMDLDNELGDQYLADSSEHLAAVEGCLLSIEKGGAQIDEEVVNRAFRAMHSVKGGAGVFDLVKIGDLAHRTESVLALIRSREIVPTPDRVRILLQSTDRLQELIQQPGTSNQADITGILAALDRVLTGQRSPAPQRHPDERNSGGRNLRMLLVEDDFASRLLLQTFLSRYGECHVAVNGLEAVEAVRSALERGERYDLICMDIMMPEMDGREAVRRARALEEEHGILSTSGAKIIMTTAVDDVKEVIRCFHELCDAYLVKPIDLGQLLSHMKTYQLVQ